VVGRREFDRFDGIVVVRDGIIKLYFSSFFLKKKKNPNKWRLVTVCVGNGYQFG